MCGEHISVSGFAPAVMGSSPHVRGALRILRNTGLTLGIIPACAGSTSRTFDVEYLDGDHPRMCGEHDAIAYLTMALAGSSPHVRGAPIAVPRTHARCGIIPACAGSTSSCMDCIRSIRDHPRMCGEHCRGVLHGRPSKGSSPHVRGALHFDRPVADRAGIIPACAGSTSFPLSR